MPTRPSGILWFDETGRDDVGRVGGKNASLGEMVQRLGAKGVHVPPGFATTADAYWRYLEPVARQNDLSRGHTLPRARLRPHDPTSGGPV